MRTHEKPCECDECYAEDLKDKYPDMPELQRYSAKEVAEVWVAYSEQSCAGWLMDDYRDDVFQVFFQAPQFFNNKENFYFSTGRLFKA